MPVSYGRDGFVAVAEVRRKREDHRLGLRGLALGMIAVVDKKPYTYNMASMFRYLEAAMNSACYEQMEDGDWFASIPALQGLWASGHTVEAARKELLEALDGWIEVTVKSGDRIPDIDGVSLYDPLKKVAS